MGMIDKETADLSEKCKQQNIVLLLSINYYKLCFLALENQIRCFVCLTQTMCATESILCPSAQGRRVSVEWKIIVKNIILTFSHYEKLKYNRICFYCIPVSV